jgi:hypothetical protein
MITKALLLLGIIVFLFLPGFVRVHGQVPDKPISLGKTETGTLSHDVPELTYAFTVRQGLNVTIEVLVADGDFTPTVTLRQGDAILQTGQASPGELSYTATYSFQEAGLYIIAVSSIDHAGGIYLLTIRESDEGVLTSLSFDMPVSASVARGESLRYAIQADAANNTIISIDIENLTRSVSARLIAADGKAIGVIGQDLDGGGFRIPSGGEQYILEVTNGENGSVPVEFSILLSRS